MKGSQKPRFSEGQAMLETVIALVFVFFSVFSLITLSRMLMARIVLDHAAARAARARSVGLNDFMCRKTARAAMIPIAGKRLWPTRDFEDFGELARVPVYLASRDEPEARGVLEYEYWNTSSLAIDDGALDVSSVKTCVKMQTDDFGMEGRSGVEAHFPHYMVNEGR